jgi:tyrosinase
MSTPAKTGIPGAVTRWDELQWNHILNAHAVHDVVSRCSTTDSVQYRRIGLILNPQGHFLPWHRYNLAIHGNLLRDECGYTGPLP